MVYNSEVRQRKGWKNEKIFIVSHFKISQVNTDSFFLERSVAGFLYFLLKRWHLKKSANVNDDNYWLSSISYFEQYFPKQQLSL